MAYACPICGGPPSCKCSQVAQAFQQYNYWHGVWGTNGEPELKEHEIPLEEWTEKLKQFVDLPTEYPEEWEKRTDIQIYLEAIHELDDNSLYWLLVHVNSQTGEIPMGFYWRYVSGQSRHAATIPPIRSITVLDAFIIREYCNRLCLKKQKEEEEKQKIKEAMDLINKKILEKGIKQIDFSDPHNKKVQKQILQYEMYANAYGLNKRELDRKIKELEKQYR